MARRLLFAAGMKTNGALFPGRSLIQPKTSFGQVLRQTPPALPRRPGQPAPGAAQPHAPLASTFGSPAVATKLTQHVLAATQKTLGHLATAGHLTTARSSAHQAVAQLQHARAAHHQIANERLDARLVDLICKELTIEFNAGGAKSRVANQDLPLPPPTPNAIAAVCVPIGKPIAAVEPSSMAVDGAVRAAQAVELIEKIETFIKDSRKPCIALTLNNSLGAKVEIERVGPREVALKVTGHRGPPCAEDIGRIRDEMAAHGLKVCALSVA